MNTSLHRPLLCAGVLLTAGVLHAQVQTLKDKFTIVSYDPAANTLAVDAVSPEAEDLSAFVLEPGTTITDRNGAAATPADLRPGSELELSWKEENYVNQLLSVLVTKSWAAGEVDLKGQLDHFDPATGQAVVGGERIVLDPAIKVQGDGGLKGEYDGFGALTLGNMIDLKGVRDANGVIHVSRASVKPYKVDKGWKDVLTKLDDQFSTRYIVWAPGVVTTEKGPGMFGNGQYASGHAQFNNSRQMLVNDPELQQYVNAVGQRVVPDWMANMPTTAPQHVPFRFAVVDNENFSLYSLPNGMIFVSTGALAQMQNEAQLASVLAREVAHVMSRHAQNRDELMENLHGAVWTAAKGKMIADGGLNAATLMKGPDPVLVDILTMLAFQGMQGDMKAAAEQSMTFLPLVVALPDKLKKDLLSILYNLRGLASPVFSSAAEQEADRIALFYMHQAGYDVREAAQAWKPFVKLTVGDGMEVLKRSWEGYLSGPKPFEGPNTLKDAGNVLLGQVVFAAADNWFGDKARCRKRFANMNLLVATQYGTMDLTSTKTGVDEYTASKQRAKALLQE